MEKFLLLIIFIFSLNFCGCSPNGALKEYESRLSEGNSRGAAEYAVSKVSGKEKPANNDILWLLQAGQAYRLANEIALSNQYFDQAEDFFKHYDLTKSEAAKGAVSISINDNVIAYEGSTYDKIMVNTYKGINFMIQNDFDLARVEFNRAFDRQRRAKETFEKEIEKLKEDIEKSDSKDKEQIKNSVENPKVQDVIQEKYAYLSDYKAYPDFVNPFTTYIAGIHAFMEGDYQKASFMFKEGYGMVPESKYIERDLRMVEDVLDGQSDGSGNLWIIVERGRGPVKKEERLDLPLFVATNQVRYFGIALPKLSMRAYNGPLVTIKADSEVLESEIVASMDRLIKTEFDKEFKGILTRAIASATVKAVAQYALEQNSDNSAAAILMMAYTMATTSADLRIWTGLPKEFRAISMNMPADRKISLTLGIPVVDSSDFERISEEIGENGEMGKDSGSKKKKKSKKEVVLPDGLIMPSGKGQIGSNTIEIEVPDAKNAVIYIKMISEAPHISYNVITY